MSEVEDGSNSLAVHKEESETCAEQAQDNSEKADGHEGAKDVPDANGDKKETAELTNAKESSKAQEEVNEEEESLPKGWEKVLSRSQNRYYFYHKATGKSVWSRREVDGIEQPSSKPLSPPFHTRKRVRDDNRDEGSKRAKQHNDQRRVAIIVPFRDQHVAQQRKEQLNSFVPHMERFLSSNQGIEAYHVFIIEQSDDGRKFNRGKLLNIGFKLALEHPDGPFDSFIFHDVDLLPQEPLKQWYAKYPSRPLHIARCWNRYNDNSKYFGGIVAFSKEDFEMIDGFPNTFWGWGGEDDELQKRVDAARMRIEAPPKHLPNAIVDLENMNLKTKLDTLRKTDWKCQVKWEAQDDYKNMRDRRETIPWWGVHGIEFKEEGTEKLGEHSTKYTVDVLYNYNADKSEHWANRKLDWK